METMNKIIVVIIAIVMGQASLLFADNLTLQKIGFSVRYQNGWSAYTDFLQNLSVNGGHISGGNEVFVHMVDDKASKELWEILNNLASKVIETPSIELSPDTNPVYVINLTLSDGTSLFYERELEKKYDNTNLDELASLIGKNERIYSHQKGNPWILK